jgi:hypothetical protein
MLSRIFSLLGFLGTRYTHVLFYRQPDAEIRRRIITYLKAHSP